MDKHIKAYHPGYVSASEETAVNIEVISLLEWCCYKSETEIEKISNCPENIYTISSSFQEENPIVDT